MEVTKQVVITKRGILKNRREGFAYTSTRSCPMARKLQWLFHDKTIYCDDLNFFNHKNSMNYYAEPMGKIEPPFNAEEYNKVLETGEPFVGVETKFERGVNSADA